MFIFFILAFGVVGAQTIPVDFTKLCSGEMTVEELQASYYPFIANMNIVESEWAKTVAENDVLLGMRNNELPSVISAYASKLHVRMAMRDEASDRAKIFYENEVSKRDGPDSKPKFHWSLKDQDTKTYDVADDLSSKNERKAIKKLYNKFKQRFNAKRASKNAKVTDFNSVKADMEQILNTSCTQ